MKYKKKKMQKKYNFKESSNPFFHYSFHFTDNFSNEIKILRVT